MFFELDSEPINKFYISRGLERGLDLLTLQTELTGKVVMMKYPRYFSIQTLGIPIRHASKLEFGGEVLFDETLKCKQ